MLNSVLDVTVTAPGRPTAGPFAQTPLMVAAVIVFCRGATAARGPHQTERPNDEPDIRADGPGATR